MTRYQFFKVFLFTSVLVLIIFGTSRMLLQNLRGFNNHEAFYDLTQDSVDVVFIGSSHSYCGFSPMELYQNYGISSYNFGTSNQSMLAGYLWAKEAYDYQKYQVLVMEAMSVPMSHGDIETDIRSLHSMGNSKHYYELATVYKRNFLKVLFPIISFHSEWENVGEVTFAKNPNPNAAYLRGFVPLTSNAGEEYKESILTGASEDTEYINYTYLDKIREFCEENNITLIIVKTPMASNEENRWNDGYHNVVAEYAQAHGIEFIDFNSEQYMREAGINIASDVAADLRHVNVQGAKKVTDFLGNYLVGLKNVEFDLYSKDSGITSNIIEKYKELILEEDTK